MLLNAVVFDAAMSASAALERLARHGIWLDPHHPAAEPWISAFAKRVGLSFDEAASRLARPAAALGAAVRRQWYARVLWYARSAADVLNACGGAAPNDTLLQALGLHEPDSRPTIPMPPSGYVPQQEGVVLDGGVPVAVSVVASGDAPAPLTAGDDPGDLRGRSTRATRGGGSSPAPPPAPPPFTIPPLWPRVDAPDYAPALASIPVVVGFALAPQARVVGGPVVLPAPPGAASVEVTVELTADGVDAADGWSRTLVVPVKDPTSVEATFQLRGRPPAGPEPVHLTMLEVRYVVGGTVCGTASRPLVIGAPTATAAPGDPGSFGSPWLAQGVSASPFTIERDAFPADLTIEIMKPDGNEAAGRYVCRLYSPHPITADRGPHDIDLGQDAKTFAKGFIQQVRDYAGDPALDNLLQGAGSLITEKLPAAALDALAEVAAVVKPAIPAVLIVSADPYVPWELALVDPPLDETRPPYLGAQALVGRWLRAGTTGQAAPRADKPPVQPPARLAVRHMAVMAGVYSAPSGLRSLPEAQAEATQLTATYDAVPLAATTQSLRALLAARLEHKFQVIGGAEAVHFAGHGEFDPSRPDSSVLFLSDGKPLSSLLFRSAKYGDDLQPLLFLNACMVGVGGELLGDMGGFPGNCLRGGFGGLLGALWEVDDAVARDVALEFWRRALPTTAGGAPEPVGAILRDLRSKYDPNGTPAPVATYLAYVYYGHPRLTLQRAV